MTTPIRTGAETTVFTASSTYPTEMLPVMLAGGGFALFWTGAETALDNSFTGVFARFYDAASAPLGAAFRVNTATSQNQNLPDVAVLANGNILASWYSEGSTTPPVGTTNFGGEMVAQILSPTGAKIGGEIILPASPWGAETAAANTPPRTVAALTNGGFAAGWVDYPVGLASGAGTVSIQMRVFNAAGAATTGDITIKAGGSLTSFDKIDVDATDDGRIFVSWRERVTSTTKQPMGQFFDASGAALGAAFAIGAVERNGFRSAIEPLSGDRLVYVYETSADSDYHVVVLNEAGAPISTPVVLGQKGEIGAVVERPDGGFFVGWTDGVLASDSVLMRGFNADGTADGAAIQLSNPPDGHEVAGNISTIVNGKMLAAWVSGFDLKVQLFTLPASPTAGADSLTGTEGADTIDGLAGNDWIGGGSGNDLLIGGLGNDTLDGGLGVDEASYAGDTLAVAANLLGGFAVQRAGQPDFTVDTLIGIENLRGGAGDDFLLGDNTANRLEGMGGGDNLWGFGGNDTLIGGEGNDIIVGGDDADSLESGLGQDWLYGQGGADTLRATDATANAFNVLVGGDGNDTLIGGPTGFDYFYGGDGATGGGNDTFVIAPNSGTKVLIDFEAGGVNDVVRLVGTAITNFAQAQAAMSFSGTINGTVLVVDGGTQIWFLNHQPVNLTAADFLFA